MIIRFNENLQVEEIDAEESINAGNNLVNEIKVFMPSNFDFNIHKGYINFKLSDGKEYNNLVMERSKKENIQLEHEMCYYYVLPKFLTKQKGTIDLSVRISPISNTNIIANTGVIKAEINYAVFENGDEVLNPDTAEELRKDISESESALKLYVQETIEDGYDLRVIGTVDSINDLPKNLTFNDVGISYFVGITYPRDIYTWGYLNDMELGWSNQGPLKVLSDDPVLEFAKDEYDKSLNLTKESKVKTNSPNIYSSSVETKFDDRVEVGEKYTLVFDTENTGASFYGNEYVFGEYLAFSCDGKRKVYVVTITGINEQIFKNMTDNSGKLTSTCIKNVMLLEGDWSNKQIPSYNKWDGKIIHEKDIEPVLLWENGNQSVGMEELDFTLSKPLIVGRRYALYYKYVYSTAIKQKLEFIYEGNGYLGYLIDCDSSTPTNYIRSRTVQIKTETTGWFSNCYTNGNIDYDRLVPTEIYELPY